MSQVLGDPIDHLTIDQLIILVKALRDYIDCEPKEMGEALMAYKQLKYIYSETIGADPVQ